MTSSAQKIVVIPDSEITEDTRLGIYVKARGGRQHRIAECSFTSLGLCLSTLYAEEQINPGQRVGIFDRLERHWLVNPHARGAA